MCKNQLVKKSNNFECEIWTLWTIFLVIWTLYAGLWLFLSYQRTFYSYPIWLPADTMDFYTTKNLLINQSIWFFQENVGVDVTLLTRNKNRSYGEHNIRKTNAARIPLLGRIPEESPIVPDSLCLFLVCKPKDESGVQHVLPRVIIQPLSIRNLVESIRAHNAVIKRQISKFHFDL